MPEASLPNIAIIMDGNSRWAEKNNATKKKGHEAGAKTLEKIALHASKIGVKHLTVFAFSEENWLRPKNEVDDLIALLNQYLSKDIKSLIKENIVIKIIGDLNKLPNKTIEKIRDIENKSKQNTGLNFVIAISYGARQEIVDATRKIIKDNLQESNINIEIFSKYLYTSEMPDPDLLIRTANEHRVSNFLLWQIAYSELYFTKTLWPDFTEQEFDLTIEEYFKRERRYGKRP